MLILVIYTILSFYFFVTGSYTYLALAFLFSPLLAVIDLIFLASLNKHLFKPFKEDLWAFIFLYILLSISPTFWFSTEKYLFLRYTFPFLYNFFGPASFVKKFFVFFLAMVTIASFFSPFVVVSFPVVLDSIFGHVSASELEPGPLSKSIRSAHNRPWSGITVEDPDFPIQLPLPRLEWEVRHSNMGGDYILYPYKKRVDPAFFPLPLSPVNTEEELRPWIILGSRYRFNQPISGEWVYATAPFRAVNYADSSSNDLGTVLASTDYFGDKEDVYNRLVLYYSTVPSSFSSIEPSTGFNKSEEFLYSSTDDEPKPSGSALNSESSELSLFYRIQSDPDFLALKSRIIERRSEITWSTYDKFPNSVPARALKPYPKFPNLSNLESTVMAYRLEVGRKDPINWPYILAMYKDHVTSTRPADYKARGFGELEITALRRIAMDKILPEIFLMFVRRYPNVDNDSADYILTSLCVFELYTKKKTAWCDTSPIPIFNFKEVYKSISAESLKSIDISKNFFANYYAVEKLYHDIQTKAVNISDYTSLSVCTPPKSVYNFTGSLSTFEKQLIAFHHKCLGGKSIHWAYILKDIRDLYFEFNNAPPGSRALDPQVVSALERLSDPELDSVQFLNLLRADPQFDQTISNWFIRSLCRQQINLPKSNTLSCIYFFFD